VADLDLGHGFVVVNAADGPGPDLQADYADVLPPLVAAGVGLVGYVDAGYGSRPIEAVEADLDAWRDWYGVHDLFLDRVPTDARHVAGVLRLLDRLRAAGAGRLVLNPGAVPPPPLCQAADAVVVFEGPWQAYLRHDPPDWLRDVPAERIGHLVHGLPAEIDWPDVARRATRLGAGIVGASPLDMPNPWSAPMLGAGHAATRSKRQR
jgi:hypothetical protein